MRRLKRENFAIHWPKLKEKYPTVIKNIIPIIKATDSIYKKLTVDI